MKLTEVIETGLEVIHEIDDAEKLHEKGDRAELGPIHVRIHGKRIKVTLLAEVEG
jgi:hypothetical protein